MSKSYYFAFGSNMNIERLKERKVNFSERVLAYISDYKLVFNKKSLGKPDQTYANIQKAESSIVEGALYLVDDESIKKLDFYEGVPLHYTRQKIDVIINKTDKKVKAWTYIANKDMITSGKPSKEYLGHLLAGKDLITESYFKNLSIVETIF